MHNKEDAFFYKRKNIIINFSKRPQLAQFRPLGAAAPGTPEVIHQLPATTSFYKSYYVVEHWSRTSDAPKELWVNAFNMSERVTIMRVGAATYGVGGVKERGMEVEREGGGQYQALPKGMFPTTVKVNVDREASLDV